MLYNIEKERNSYVLKEATEIYKNYIELAKK